MQSIIRTAALHALATALYVVGVASFLFYVPQRLLAGKEDIVLAPIAMLALLVLSVAVVGSLLFGRPVLWYLDGRKADAVRLLAWIIGLFGAFVVVAFAGLVLLS